MLCLTYGENTGETIWDFSSQSRKNTRNPHKIEQQSCVVIFPSNLYFSGWVKPAAQVPVKRQQLILKCQIINNNILCGTCFLAFLSFSSFLASQTEQLELDTNDVGICWALIVRLVVFAAIFLHFLLKHSFSNSRAWFYNHPQPKPLPNLPPYQLTPIPSSLPSLNPPILRQPAIPFPQQNHIKINQSHKRHISPILYFYWQGHSIEKDCRPFADHF